MAGHTLGNPLVLIFVAVDAQKIPVLGGGLCQLLGFFGMAPGAEARRHEIVVGDLGRHMRLMAAAAVFIDHVRRVRVVALLTLEKLPVPTVTLRAVEQRMRAGIFLQLLSLMGMTGSTGRRDPRRSRKLDLPGTMGGMATETIPHGEVAVLTRLVATGTSGDSIRPPWRMFNMTIQTGHGRLVQASAGFDISDLALMALLAIPRLKEDQHALRPNRIAGKDS